MRGEPASRAAVARRVAPEDAEILDVLGATVAFLAEPADDDASPCVMRGTIPPGGAVPLHSHPDAETFVVLSGEIEATADSADGVKWNAIGPGDAFHVPAGAPHAFRNRARTPATALVVTTARLGRFFREIGAPLVPGRGYGPPPPERVRQFLDIAARYGHWNATPEENAQIGIALPPAA